MKSTLTVRVMCALFFIVFTFCYLFFYQDSVLAMAQHVLSNGQTVYNRTIGALIITFVLYLLHLGVYAITGLAKRTFALNFFPSLLILTVLTDVSPHIDEGFSFGGWWIAIPLLLLLFLGLVYVARQFLPWEPEIQYNGFWSKMMWMNLMELVVMFFLVCSFSNTNDVFHYRMDMEQYMIQGQYRDALQVGRKSAATDSSLTMLRITSLSRTGQLGNRLFEYPLVGGSSALFPDSVTTKVMVYPEDSIRYFMGIKFKQKMSPMHYLKFLEKHHLMKEPARDYLLCGYLLDKKLDLFVSSLLKYYRVDSVLPKHYKEALILYTHRRANPKIVYHSSVMDADYQDYQTMEHQYQDLTVRQNMLRDTYGNTYWYYYQYHK